MTSLSGMSLGGSAVVSVGSVLGMGGSMIQVPLSQLSFDQSSQHITLNVAQSDLTSILNAGDSTRSTTE
jgi:uncharacterized membrane protein YfcA